MQEGVSPCDVLLKPGVVRGCCGFSLRNVPRHMVQRRHLPGAWQGWAGKVLAIYCLQTWHVPGILALFYLLLLYLARGFRGSPAAVAQLQHLCHSSD